MLCSRVASAIAFCSGVFLLSVTGGLVAGAMLFLYLGLDVSRVMSLVRFSGSLATAFLLLSLLSRWSRWVDE